MNNIEVPYMPISSFDAFEISEKFSETQPEKIELDGEAKYTLEGSKKKKLSKDVGLILLGMGMEKYVELFTKNKMQLDTFLHLDETDLNELGIDDLEDRRIIAENLGFLRTDKNEYTISENNIDDFKIFSNVLRQLFLLQSYCAYVDLKMKKQCLTDYKINEEESAYTYLKAFTESALVQCQILSEKLYNQYSSDSLLDKILKANNLTLPEFLGKKLPKKKCAKTRHVLKILIIVGFSSLLLITGKHMMRRLHIL